MPVSKLTKKISIVTGVSFAFSCVLIGMLCLPEFTHKNNKPSISHGTRSDGALENGFLLPYAGDNFKKFSWISYYMMNNAYVNDKVGTVVLKSYKELFKNHSKHKYTYMECSDKHGGRLNFHRTHRNGLSIDFMTPKTLNGKPSNFFDWLGLGHYFLEFDNRGNIKPIYPYLNHISPNLANWFANKFIDYNVSLDFDRMALHLIALHKATKNTNVRIRKVIFKIELKQKLFQSKYGSQLKSCGIPFATKLSTATNDMHDEHYHIDFTIIEH